MRHNRKRNGIPIVHIHKLFKGKARTLVCLLVKGRIYIIYLGLEWVLGDGARKVSSLNYYGTCMAW